MKTIFHLIFFLTLGVVSNAQPIPFDSLYLGETPPGNIPKLFKPTRISKDGFCIIERFAISDNGEEIMFNEMKFDRSISRLISCTYINGKWNEPVSLFENLFAPSLSPDGNILYMLKFAQNNTETWYTQKNGSSWNSPQLFTNLQVDLYYFQLTGKGNYFAANSVSDGNLGNLDICKVIKNGTSLKFINLGRPINTDNNDGEFFISRDESFIILGANESISGNNRDLYISFRKKDSTWTNPKSLGVLINDGTDKWGPYVTVDNKYLFYSRTLLTLDPTKYNTYWVKIDNLLDSLKHTNFEPYLKNQIKDQSVSVKHSFIFTIPDTTFLDDDGNNTLTYSASLDNGNTLPSWLSFNPNKRTFSGMPKIIGKLVIKVTATDKANASVSCNFEFQIKDK